MCVFIQKFIFRFVKYGKIELSQTAASCDWAARVHVQLLGGCCLARVSWAVVRHANYEVVKLVRYLFHQVYFCSSLVGNLLVKFTWNLKLLAIGVWIWKPWGRCLGSDFARISEAVLRKPVHLLGFSTSTQVRVFSEMCKEIYKIDSCKSKNRETSSCFGRRRSIFPSLPFFLPGNVLGIVCGQFIIFHVVLSLCARILNQYTFIVTVHGFWWDRWIAKSSAYITLKISTGVEAWTVIQRVFHIVKTQVCVQLSISWWATYTISFLKRLLGNVFTAKNKISPR